MSCDGANCKKTDCGLSNLHSMKFPTVEEIVSFIREDAARPKVWRRDIVPPFRWHDLSEERLCEMLTFVGGMDLLVGSESALRIEKHIATCERHL
jgi:hypothetical protein